MNQLQQLLAKKCTLKKIFSDSRWVLTLLLCLVMGQANATVIRVDGTKSQSLIGGPGTTWLNAYSSLFYALQAANSGDELWVKAATYTPPGGGSATSYDFNSFSMKSGVKVYGGFNGTETALSQRNPATNLVTLKPTYTGYPVLYYNSVTNTSLLDGVTVADGNAYINSGANGGAITCLNSSPVINNVIFNNNTSIFYGAAYILNGAPTFTNVTFSNNKSNGAGGGAVYSYTSNPVFTNVTFTNNSTSGSGGALAILGNKPVLTTVTFTGNSAAGNGGAVYLQGSGDNPIFTNVQFLQNKAGLNTNGTYNTSGSGGAIYTTNASCTITNSVIFNNRAGGDGGGMFNTIGTDNNRIPAITNVLFNSNGTYTGSSGAIGNDRSSPHITNCTFYNNYYGAASGAGGVYTFSPAGTIDQPIATITNCLFSQNGYTSGGSITTLSDIVKLRASNTVTYSSFKELSAYPGGGNVATVANPFVNSNLPIGADGIWMTADDGLQLSVCGNTLIDKGDNSAISLATDLAGQPRKKDVNLIPDGGNGMSPVVDMGAYENQSTATLLSITGSIGNAHTIPYPQELLPDYVTNITSPASGTVINWEKQDATSTDWLPATPASTDLQYPIQQLTQTTSFRRVVQSSTYCNAPFYSNVIQVKVVNPNGAISGKVISKNGTGVQGIVITVTRISAIASGPAGYTYTATTDLAGDYSVNPVYYGDPATGNVSAAFSVVPSKPGHGFSIPGIDKTLSANIPQLTGVNFTDTTVLSITGRTYQECVTCTSPSGTTEMQTCPIDSVNIYKDNAYNTVSGLINNEYGRFAVTVTDPGQVKIQPFLTGHTFSPAFTNVTLNNNVSGVDFKDVTTHTITGRLTAGCNNYIGTAVLEFTDVLPKNADSTIRSSCFRKQVTTNAGSGFYSITLPARKYRVRIVGFTPTSSQYPVTSTEVTDFINNKIPADSLTRDISTRDTTLNLVYTRPPVIGITGLSPVCIGSGFALIRQSTTDSFRVSVYQGDPSLFCPLSDTNKIRIVTNVQNEDQAEELLYAVADSGTKVKLKGGIPNITGDHLKDLVINFKDKYGRSATAVNRKVLVTGVKSDAATFTTVSPELPLVVLHDPPGDASSSTWQSSQSISNAIRFYTAASVGAEAWVESKIGVQSTVGIGVATDISAWGTIRGTIGVNATVTPSNEAILTTTTSQNFSTSGNPDVIGNSGDVYIGAALNLVYAVATEIGFNNCGVTSNRRLIIANNGFNTQYIYSEDFIVNTLIPNLQSLAQLQPDSAARYLNQVKVWQQVIDNNAENKRRAAFVQNYSFDGSAGPYTNTTTTSASKTSTLEFAVEVNASVAAELGFEIAGSGASGGASVNFKIETGGSNSNTVTNETTISYTLDDNTPGDYFSVNVKKDPVYNTPVFELAAGTASCPIEPGAQPRDAIFFTAVNPVVQVVNPANPATFNLKIVNTSPSSSTNPNDKRTYKLNYVQSSNVANETITIAGSPFQSNSPYILSPLGYLDSAIIPVSITRQNGSSVYSYEGERFTIANICDEDLGKTVAVSAYYTSPCSSIALTQPADGWLLTSTDNNQIFIKPASYDVSALTSVNLQYSFGTSNNWTDGPFISTTQLANGFNFDVSSLPDGACSIRLRLDCNSGTVFSPRTSGIIDRKAPALFGRPDPTDDDYVNGNIIAFTYDEKLNTNPNGLQVTMRRLSNGVLIPATASIYDNKILITPASSITGFTGDSIRVIVSGVSDIYKNVKAAADTTRFTVGTTVAATGNRALFVTITNPAVYKNNDTGAIKVMFNLPANATNDTRVNYTISGTARYGIDYTATYTGADALYASFNGSAGSIKIPNGSRQATLTLKPIFGDTSLSADKTIIISAVEGGDYSLGATTAVTGTLTSEDGISVYTFTGDGNFNIRNNWQNGKMPLTTLTSGKEIIINPSGTCVLNIVQTVKRGGKLTVKQNRVFVVQSHLRFD